MKYADYFSRSGKDALELLKTSLAGLAPEEAAKRLVEYGPNAVEYQRPDWRKILGRQFNSFFIYLLAGAAAIDIITGDALDAGFIVLFILIFTGAGFYQEWSAEKSVFNLRKFLQRYARVHRGGETKEIPTQDLVPGDILFLIEGDLIPADVRFLTVKNLLVDESVLTGESLPVSKTADQLSQENIQNDLDAENMGFSGSNVVGGSGEAVVVATGAKTYFAGIFEKINQIERPSNFELNLRRISKFLTFLFIALALFIFALRLLTGRGVDLSFLIFAVALLVAVIPEALPLVATLAFSKGSLKLARENVVVKRLTSLEDLGSIDVLCTDKTGTITENRLTAVDFFGEKKKLLELAFIGAHASKKINRSTGSFDAAIIQAATSLESRLQTIEFLDSLPFDPVRKTNSVLYRDGRDMFVLVRGAPEDILKSSVRIARGNGANSELSQKDIHDVHAWFGAAGLRGERVLAIGFKKISGPAADLKAEERVGLVFAGLISFSDPLKKSSEDAARLISRLGVQLKIITGDSKEVAGAVGHRLGLLKSPEEVMTGDEFERLDAAGKRDAAERFNVFARTLPEHKHEIIRILKEKHTVGFLGEGFNDVPALEEADLALVVDNASDVARDVSDIVLLKRDLMVIAEGIGEGRKIFANVIKYIRGTLSANIGNFFTLAIATFMLPFLPMLSVQILLLNFITDFPMVAISVDNVSREEVRVPQKYALSELYVFIILFGILSAAFDILFLMLFKEAGEGILQTGWFLYSVLQELAAFISLRTLLPVSRGGLPSKAIMGFLTAASIAGVAVVLYPVTARLFNFHPLQSHHFVLIGLVIAGSFIGNEFLKNAYRRFKDIRFLNPLSKSR